MNFEKINNKKLFLIDGIGALTTATVLLVLAVNFQAFFGLPEKVLLLLSVIAFLFSIYSIFCAFLVKNSWRNYFKIIAILNLCYCLLTIIILIVFFKEITFLGLLYFILEITMIMFLVSLEVKKTKS